MEDGYMKADSGNLPKVTADMIGQFYMDNMDYISAEVKNIKNQRATKDSYGDNAVGYVLVKRGGTDLCIVKAKVTPEHKVRQKPYLVEAQINEQQGLIVSSKCMDCAASAGGCKHSIAFLFWLHRRSEEPACTSVTSYWQKSALSKVGNHKMDIGSIFDFKLAESGWPETPKQIDLTKIPSGVLTEVLKSPELELSIYQMWLQYREGGDIADPDNFIEFMSARMTDEAISKAARDSSEKNKSKLWYELRFGRITASVVYDTYKCKTPEGSLLEKIMGASKKLETVAVKRGSLLEADVLKRVSEIKNIKIEKVGIILNKNYPCFGASPDGISNDFCIEVKCPSSEKTLKNYIVGNKITNKYFYQLQMQMYFANKSKGLFCVASPNFEQDREVTIVDVCLDRDELEIILTGCLEFWKSSVYLALKNIRKV